MSIYNNFGSIHEVGACGLFVVSDVVGEKEEPFGELVQQSDDMAFPIAIRISPYATQRDLIDFVKSEAIWKNEIQFLQDKYRSKDIKIGKIKSKNEKIQKRNDFIYEHKDLPRKEIMSMANRKFGINIDYGHIGKIISLENKKRKELSS